MVIKTAPHPPYSPDLASCDFWLFPKVRGFSYETIEGIKEAVMKVIGTLKPEDFNGAFQKLLERHKCIAAGEDYFEGAESFMCELLIKVPTRKKSGYSTYAPCILFINGCRKISISLLSLFVGHVRHAIYGSKFEVTRVKNYYVFRFSCFYILFPLWNVNFW